MNKQPGQHRCTSYAQIINQVITFSQEIRKCPLPSMRYPARAAILIHDCSLFRENDSSQLPAFLKNNRFYLHNFFRFKCGWYFLLFKMWRGAAAPQPHLKPLQGRCLRYDVAPLRCVDILGCYKGTYFFVTTKILVHFFKKKSRNHQNYN